MGESRRKRDKRPSIKPTEKLSPLQICKDEIVSARQREFCRSIIDRMFEDESSVSFSKPVDKIWDPAALTDYFQKIKRPMDLGTVRKRTFSRNYNINPESSLFDPNKYREEVRLVFLNAVSYNGKASEFGRLGTKFLQFIDTELEKLPQSPSKDEDGKVVSNNNKKKVDDGEEGDDEGGDDSGVDDDDGDGDDGEPGESSKGTTGMDGVKRKVGGGDEFNIEEEYDNEVNEGKSDKKSNKKKSSEDGDNNDKATAKTEDGDGDVDMEDSYKAKDDDDDKGRDSDKEMDDIKKSGGDIEEERTRLEIEMSRLSRTRSKAHAVLAEIELERNVPLSYEENSKLRDEVEALPWEISQKVVKILKTYVDDALRDCDENDPEFVTLEFSTVEPRLLREIESLIRPDPRVEKEKSTIVNVEKDIDSVRRKLKRLNDGYPHSTGGSSSSGKKKKSRKSR